SAPVVSDGATVTLGGFLNRRVEIRTWAAYSSGAVGVTGTRSPFDTLNGRRRLQFALSHEIALFGEYSYYQYHFRSTEGLPFGVSPNLQRASVRAGLTLFLPVID